MFHRRRIYLINRKFQLRFSVYVCSWLIALTFIYPLIISQILAHYVKPALPEAQQHIIFIFFILMQGVFLGLAFVMSIFMSHRIAGPISRLTKYFSEVKQGRLDHTLTLRKTDYFQEIVPAYNEMLSTLREKFKKKNDSITSAINGLEKVIANPGQDHQNQLEQTLINLRMTLVD